MRKDILRKVAVARVRGHIIGFALKHHESPVIAQRRTRRVSGEYDSSFAAAPGKPPELISVGVLLGRRGALCALISGAGVGSKSVNTRAINL